MRISDWSSDVCSSDLVRPIAAVAVARRAAPFVGLRADRARSRGRRRAPAGRFDRPVDGADAADHRAGDGADNLLRVEISRVEQGGDRSEEHTSELQSLMRISYAVFCLKKKKKK